MDHDSGRSKPVGSASETVLGDFGDAEDWLDVATDAEALAAESPAELGTLIRDRFELEAVIGAGSMGVVYRALDRLHLEMEDRAPYVAIKVLREEFKQHPNALITLQREVRKAQTLAHENIIGVYSFERENALVYMTMELLDGQPLRELIAENSHGLPAKAVVPMIQSMARALAYAHDNDIVHSDFTPGNVFLTARGQIKVLDFGVARGAPQGRGAGQNTGSLDGARGMTPAYASPQMLDGEEPEPSDDVFSLAIVIYELLTGSHPFDRLPANEVGAKPPNAHALAGLTRPQRKALMRALSPERQSRHANAGEFLEEFARSGRVRVAAQLGIVVAAGLGVLAIAALRDGEPDISREDLVLEERLAFDDALGEGETALAFVRNGDAPGDVNALNEAHQYFSIAQQILPNDPTVRQGFEDVADEWLALLPDLEPDRRTAALALLSCPSFMIRYRPLAEACERYGVECTAMAQRCATAGN